MYHAHWGLRSSPFGGSAGDTLAKTIPNPAFEEALARLQYLVAGQGRLGLLMGAAGTGKTTLLRRFVDRARRDGIPAALVGGCGCDERTYTQQLTRAWQVPATQPDDLATAWELISNQLAEWRYERQPAILVLDDADRAPAGVRQLIERVLHLALTQQALLTVFLACSTETAASVGHRLLEQVELRIDLSPWSEDETAEHVARMIYESGGEHPIFTDDAIATLHELSGGIPRKVDQIAELALLAGAGQELSEIDAATLLEAYQELGTGSL
ncbi:NACHT domain protein [Anatilimnocola aggregata]|uniref:NACHT domain protein n=1 Tax=Anatilimnocola aggregata TaxID=2528021 RepID=A0A517Y869_9BACT|nr:AAA family ATPase [Anatilimnocola aggregata]QDU26391.1 NACHT domain protein [Anatilimnocola aggregata]